VRFAIASVLFLMLKSALSAEEVKILSPSNDTIFLTDEMVISGTFKGGPAKFTLTVSDPEHPELPSSGVEVSACPSGYWQGKIGKAKTGRILIVVKFGNAADSILLTRGSNIGRRHQQKVCFSWDAGADRELEKIANNTINRKLPQQVLTQFIQGVHDHTVLVFARAYASFDIEIVDSPGVDVHNIIMIKNASDVFGQTRFDCGNRDLEKTSEIWVGSYRLSMEGSRFERWGPMASTDSWRERMIDLGEAIGRTCAHELGHGLGLVGPSEDAQCGWMLGCDDGHNWDRIDRECPPAQRFHSGWCIMDPNGKSLNNARIAEPRPNQRSTRQPAAFNAFNRSYIHYIHPKP